MLSSKRRSPRPAPVRCRPAPHRRPLNPAWWVAAATLPLLAAAWAGAAHGQAQGSLAVQATVTGSCSINSVNNVNFNPYESGQADDETAEGGFTVTCPASQLVTIKLDGGGNFASAGLLQNERGMTQGNGGTDVLGYNLYIDVGHGSIWGDGTFGSVHGPVQVDSSNSFPATVFGKVRGGQNVSPGSYSDTVTITLEVTPIS